VPHCKPVAAASQFLRETPPPAGGSESGETDAPEAVFAVNQGVQPVLNAMRCPGNGILNAINRHPKRGVDYAFNTPGAAPFRGMRCSARLPTLLDEQDLLTVPTRSPTSFPTACTIFELLNDTLDIAYNTLTSKNGLLCLLVRDVCFAGAPLNSDEVRL